MVNKVEFSQAPMLDLDVEAGPFEREAQIEDGARAVIWNLGRHLQANGFQLEAVNDGQRDIPCSDFREAMEHIFNAINAPDDPRLFVRREGFDQKCLWLNLAGGFKGGVGDYEHDADDGDQFHEVLQAFDVGAVLKRVPTPGRWETSARADVKPGEDPEWTVCIAGGGDLVADLTGTPNAEANANQIAAAKSQNLALLHIANWASKNLDHASRTDMVDIILIIKGLAAEAILNAARGNVPTLLPGGDADASLSF